MSMSLLSTVNTGRPRTAKFVQTFQTIIRPTSTSSEHAGIQTHHARLLGGHPFNPSFPLSRLSTFGLVRSLLLSTFFASPILFGPGMTIIRAIANSKSSLLDPDGNRLLKGVIKPFIYDQFCAGTNISEVQKTIADIKKLGFAGVILCYGRETEVNKDKTLSGYVAPNPNKQNEEIEQWRDGNLETLSMIDRGDWLGIKMTGAGQGVTECLMYGQEPPPLFLQAMSAICEQAALQGCRIWIDAEQQVVQKSIDEWTINLMRRYNTGGKVLVYNTIQAYLKASRTKLQHQLRLASEEGWLLGVKLVRGAYIGNDNRENIHNTKGDTDFSYDSIVKDLLAGTLPGFSNDNFPGLELFLAGHNTETIRKAIMLAKDLSRAGKLKVVPEFGQLQGMADEIGCEIIQTAGQDGLISKGDSISTAQRQIYEPAVYKCLIWGTVRECMQYLVRRAVENQGATGKLKEGVPAITAELWRRCTRLPWSR